MAQRIKSAAKKRRPDTYRDVFLYLSAKDLNPDKITKTLGIQPDVSWQRGLMKDKHGIIIKDKNGKSKRWSFGSWILDSHASGNSGLETRIKDILMRISPQKAVLRRILKKVNGVLIIVVEPHKDVCTASYLFYSSTFNEFTSLGIDIEFRIDIPQKWDEFRREIIKKK